MPTESLQVRGTSGAGGARVKDGKRLSVSLIGFSGNVYVDEMFELIRSDWQSVGVNVETRTATTDMLFSALPGQGILPSGKFGIALFSLGSLRPDDLEAYFSCKQVPPAGDNFSRICDRRLDGLFEQYRLAADDETADTLAREIQVQINELLPAIVVVKRNECYLFHSSVTGFNPQGNFSEMIDVDVK